MQNCGGLKRDPRKKLVDYNMSAAGVQNEHHGAIIHATFKVLEPLIEDLLRHLRLSVVSILASHASAQDIFEISGVGVLPDYPERKLVDPF